MSDHVIAVATFPDTAAAFDAVGRLRSAANDDRLKVISGGIVTRDPDGPITVFERQDAMVGTDLRNCCLSGLVVGVLSGPLGLLLGWGAGAVLGAYREDRSGPTDESTLAELSRRLTPNTAAIITEVVTPNADELAAVLADTSVQIVQRPAKDVLVEVEAAEQAAGLAQHAAIRALAAARRAAQQHTATSEQSWAQRLDSLKAKVTT